jgi:poly-gamma-glutamate synthesis protein (capsule biosynthesis protein)
LYFVCDTENKKVTKPLAKDMNRVIAAIEEARRQADYVLVSFHGHEFAGDDTTNPADFMVEFSRACIDAGADAVIGHGPHELRGIEIYKEKPIFYSLGNFIFQPDYVTQTPADMVEMYGFPLSMSGAEVSEARVKKGSASMEKSQIFYLSVVPKWTIENGKLTEIKLLPIELGLKEPKGLKGFPTPTKPEMVFEDLQAVCREFGTELVINGDTIDVVL